MISVGTLLEILLPFLAVMLAPSLWIFRELVKEIHANTQMISNLDKRMAIHDQWHEDHVGILK